MEISAVHACRAGRTMIIGTALALALAACSATPVSKTGALDPRLSWPCDRLIAEWATEEQRLQKMVGDDLRVQRIDGATRLQLHVLRCQPLESHGRNAQVLTYSSILVPVSGDSAPIAITRVPSDTWLSLQYAAATGDARALQEKLGYQVIEAQHVFTIDDADGAATIAIELTLDNGRVSIRGKITGDPSARTSATAIVAGGDGYVSAFFGEESSRRYTVSADVIISGETPLSYLSGAPAAVTLDRMLMSDRIYWRVPRPEGARK